MKSLIPVGVKNTVALQVLCCLQNEITQNNAIIKTCLCFFAKYFFLNLIWYEFYNLQNYRLIHEKYLCIYLDTLYHNYLEFLIGIKSVNWQNHVL